MKQAVLLLLALSSCAVSNEPDLARICQGVETKFQAATKGAPMQMQTGVQQSTWQRQSVNPLVSSVAVESRSWSTTGESRHQLGALVVRYKDDATASGVAAKLTAQGESLKGLKVLTRFRAVARGNVVLILFTETVLSEPALSAVQSLNSSWIRGD